MRKVINIQTTKVQEVAVGNMSSIGSWSRGHMCYKLGGGKIPVYL